MVRCRTSSRGRRIWSRNPRSHQNHSASAFRSAHCPTQPECW